MCTTETLCGHSNHYDNNNGDNRDSDNGSDVASADKHSQTTADARMETPLISKCFSL